MASSKVKSNQAHAPEVHGGLAGNAELGHIDSQSGDSCVKCDSPLVVIRLDIDGNVLLMQSCETCDVRTWRLDGAAIERSAAIAEVGERAGRRPKV